MASNSLHNGDAQQKKPLTERQLILNERITAKGGDGTLSKINRSPKGLSKQEGSLGSIIAA